MPEDGPDGPNVILPLVNSWTAVEIAVGHIATSACGACVWNAVSVERTVNLQTCSDTPLVTGTPIASVGFCHHYYMDNAGSPAAEIPTRSAQNLTLSPPL